MTASYSHSDVSVALFSFMAIFGVASARTPRALESARQTVFSEVMRRKTKQDVPYRGRGDERVWGHHRYGHPSGWQGSGRH